jgi:hypothetical protein
MVKQKTRKLKKGLMTIPQLRKAFDHIERFTDSLLKKTSDKDERRKAFQKEWSKVFHRSVDDKSANAYLAFEEKKMGKAKKSGTRKQKGGAPLSGAPLDYSTRPGIEGVYGVFPAYITSGFDFYNDINKEAPLAGCGIENTTPKVPISIGSNEVQKGGKRGSRKTRKSRQGGGAFPSISEFAQAVTSRPITSTNPPNMAYTAQMDFKGLPSPPSSVTNTANPPYINYKAPIFTALATDIQRNLGSEIRS